MKQAIDFVSSTKLIYSRFEIMLSLTTTRRDLSTLIR